MRDELRVFSAVNAHVCGVTSPSPYCVLNFDAHHPSLCSRGAPIPVCRRDLPHTISGARLNCIHFDGDFFLSSA